MPDIEEDALEVTESVETEPMNGGKVAPASVDKESDDILIEESSNVEEEIPEDLVYREINVVKPGNVEKAHGGLITSVILFDVEKIKGNGLYPSSISDGRRFSNKVIFKDTLTDKVEKELLGKIMIVKLESTEIIKGAVIGVIDVTILEDGPQSVLCNTIKIFQTTKIMKF